MKEKQVTMGTIGHELTQLENNLELGNRPTIVFYIVMLIDLFRCCIILTFTAEYWTHTAKIQITHN